MDLKVILSSEGFRIFNPRAERDNSTRKEKVIYQNKEGNTQIQIQIHADTVKLHKLTLKVSNRFLRVTLKTPSSLKVCTKTSSKFTVTR